MRDRQARRRKKLEGELANATWGSFYLRAGSALLLAALGVAGILLGRMRAFSLLAAAVVPAVMAVSHYRSLRQREAMSAASGQGKAGQRAAGTKRRRTNKPPRRRRNK